MVYVMFCMSINSVLSIATPLSYSALQPSPVRAILVANFCLDPDWLVRFDNRIIFFEAAFHVLLF